MTNEEAVWTLQEAVDEAFGAGIEIITRDGCEAIEMAIESLQEHKTGKWIETGYIDGTNVLDGKCSHCGEWIDVKRKSVVGCLRYCPFCGAKMEVDE